MGSDPGAGGAEVGELRPWSLSDVCLRPRSTRGSLRCHIFSSSLPSSFFMYHFVQVCLRAGLALSTWTSIVHAVVYYQNIRSSAPHSRQLRRFRVHHRKRRDQPGGKSRSQDRRRPLAIPHHAPTRRVPPPPCCPQTKRSHQPSTHVVSGHPAPTHPSTRTAATIPPVYSYHWPRPRSLSIAHLHPATCSRRSSIAASWKQIKRLSVLDTQNEVVIYLVDRSAKLAFRHFSSDVGQKRTSRALALSARPVGSRLELGFGSFSSNVASI